jgi:hypothetical protein
MASFGWSVYNDENDDPNASSLGAAPAAVVSSSHKPSHGSMGELRQQRERAELKRARSPEAKRRVVSAPNNRRASLGVLKVCLLSPHFILCLSLYNI